jgi:hypothetical protein
MADTLLLLDEHIRHRLKLNFSSFLIDSFWCGASPPPRAAPQIHLLNFELATS